jgi:hypothetical protein
MATEDELQIEKLRKDERTERFRKALEDESHEETPQDSQAQFTTQFPASGGKNWDLHNFADFTGFSFDAPSRRLQLGWLVRESEKNPWGDPTNHARSCSLHFEGVNYLQVGPRKSSLPYEEDLTLEEIVRVRPGESSHDEYALAASDGVFALRFQFYSEAWIEVIADRVRLLSERGECDP